jgi:hypothetical protein
MKVRYIQLTGASGSIGGMTAARNRGGSYLRSRVAPVNPNTAAQIGARSRMAALASRWRDTLTATQRGDWDAYAATISETDPLGQPVALTGLNVYVAGNALRGQAGRDPVDAAPTVPGRAALSFDLGTMILDDTAGGGDLTIESAGSNTWLVEGGSLLVYGSGSVSPARNYRVPTPFRKALTPDIAPLPTFPLSITGIFPTDQPVAGEFRFVRFAAVDDTGRIALPVEVRLEVTAAA